MQFDLLAADILTILQKSISALQSILNLHQLGVLILTANNNNVLVYTLHISNKVTSTVSIKRP